MLSDVCSTRKGAAMDSLFQSLRFGMLLSRNTVQTTKKTKMEEADDGSGEMQAIVKNSAIQKILR